MTKFMKKLMGLVIGLSLVAGVGIGVGSTQNRGVIANAASGDTYTFTGTSGTATDGNWSFASDKGTSSSTPYYGSNQLRLYPNNYIEFEAADGYSLENASFVCTINANKNGVKPTGWSSDKGTISDFSDSATSFTVTNIKNNTFKVYIAGSAGNVGLNSVAITYSGGSAPVTSVTIDGQTSSSKNITSGYFGDTYELTGVVTYSTGATSSAIDWTSSSESVATVSNSGLVTFVANGSTTITAKAKSDSTKSATCNISLSNLVAKYTSNIDLTTTDQVGTATNSLLTYVDEGRVVSFSKNTSSQNATNYYPGTSGKTYSSTRAYSGFILGFESGTGNKIVSIQATCTSVSYATKLSNTAWWPAGTITNPTTQTVIFKPTAVLQTINVSIKDTVGMSAIEIVYAENTSPTIKIDTISGHLTAGDEGTFTAAISRATSPVVTWSSSDDNILTVLDDGTYEAAKYGVVTLTASMTCTESPTTPVVDTCEVIVDAGLISIADALSIANALADKEVTKYKVTLEGYITNMSETKSIDISKEASGTTSDTIMVFGVYDENPIRTYGIIDGIIEIKGVLTKYDTTPEIKNIDVLDYLDGAETYAKDSYNSLNEVCAGPGVGGVTDAMWNPLSTSYSALSDAEKTKLQNNSEGYDEAFANWINRYETIVSKGGKTNFMNRSVTSSMNNRILNLSSDYSIGIILVIAFVSVSSITAFILVKKYKRRHE